MMEIKDKPDSMSIREWITKKIAIGENIPEGVVKNVVSHQFDTALSALDNNNSVEISGFGVFKFRESTAKKEMEKCLSLKETYEEVLNDKTISEEKRHAYEKRLNTVVTNYEYIKKKLK